MRKALLMLALGTIGCGPTVFVNPGRTGGCGGIVHDSLHPDTVSHWFATYRHSNVTEEDLGCRLVLNRTEKVIQEAEVKPHCINVNAKSFGIKKTKLQDTTVEITVEVAVRFHDGETARCVWSKQTTSTESEAKAIEEVAAAFEDKLRQVIRGQPPE